MSMEENFADADRDHVDRMFTSRGHIKTGVWKTRDGSEIRIKDMGDRHLINSIRMLERNVDKARQTLIDSAESILTTMNGEMAQYAIESGIRDLESGEVDIEEVFPVYEELTEEAELRRLKWFKP